MTCIVGYIDKASECVRMGGDSAASDGSRIIIRRDSKVFRKGNFIIGCTTSFRMIDLLRYKLEIPPINTESLFEYMCTDFVDAVRKCFKDNGFLGQSESKAETGGDFLVGYKNRLFGIESDFQVSENMEGYAAIGCGMDFALGSLFATANDENLSIKDKIVSALYAAQHYAVGVSEPFSFVRTGFFDEKEESKQ